MLPKIILALVFAIVAYLACILVGDIVSSLNLAIAVVVGAFLKGFAGVISVLVFLFYAFSL